MSVTYWYCCRQNGRAGRDVQCPFPGSRSHDPLRVVAQVRALDRLLADCVEAARVGPGEGFVHHHHVRIDQVRQQRDRPADQPRPAPHQSVGAGMSRRHGRGEQGAVRFGDDAPPSGFREQDGVGDHRLEAAGPAAGALRPAAGYGLVRDVAGGRARAQVHPAATAQSRVGHMADEDRHDAVLRVGMAEEDLRLGEGACVVVDVHRQGGDPLQRVAQRYFVPASGSCRTAIPRSGSTLPPPAPHPHPRW